ncbi:hypothetical protein V2J09_010527 [Rumex salicifolius]
MALRMGREPCLKDLQGFVIIAKLEVIPQSGVGSYTAIQPKHQRMPLISVIIVRLLGIPLISAGRCMDILQGSRMAGKGPKVAAAVSVEGAKNDTGNQTNLSLTKQQYEQLVCLLNRQSSNEGINHAAFLADFAPQKLLKFWESDEIRDVSKNWMKCGVRLG